ncbi:MAG TPA: glycoside hydrolase family 2 TIM barrel-domain containing protein, partial [Actinoplanes sp.]
MEIARRNFIALGAAGVAGLAAGQAVTDPAAAAPAATAPGTDGSAHRDRATATQRQMLSGADAEHTVDWEFMVTAGRNANVWSTIPVPSNWDFHGFGTYTSGWTLVPEERGLYKHTFTAPAAWSDRRTYIVFEGAMTDTTVTVNGQVAGPTHQGGFYRFRYDVTDLLRYGQSNLLEVTVLRDSTDESVNRAERLGDYWNFGGIYRPVYLQSYPVQHIDRIALDAKADGSISVDAYLGGITSADRVVAQVTTLDGRPVGAPFSAPVAAGAESVNLRSAITGIRPWSAEAPNRYRVDVRIFAGSRELHHMDERFGFRTVEVRAGDGIYINGRKERFKGANRHIIWPDSGRAVTPGISRLDIELMKQMNMNAVRMSHYPPDTYFLDLCDELGLYVIDELAGWQKMYDEAPAVPLVRSLVTRDVNHPSVIFWANGNEGGWQVAVDDDYHLYDPQKRPVIHPWTTHSGINTDHYETYDQTITDLNRGTIFMSTEMLHALYDGGAGAGLEDYWDLMGTHPRSAGGFIWALVDEGIRRDDRGGVIDVNPNYYPDGILGPYREKEGSFYTIKDIWSPIQLTDRDALEAAFPDNFSGTVPITNRYTFTNTRQLRFSWQLVDFRKPSDGRTGHNISARADIASPDIAPGGQGVLRLKLPTNWRRADALILKVRDAGGEEIVSWTWTIATPADHAKRIVRPARTGSTTATEDAAGFTLTAGGTVVTIDRATGRLSSVRADGTAVSL